MDNINHNLTWSHSLINSFEREELYGHKSILLWFTGLSGSGKSTIARLLERNLYNLGIKTFLLDGDNIRKGISSDLSFNNHDRIENIRRISEISKLMVQSGLFVLTACISPFHKDRNNIRNMIGKSKFIEIFVDTPLEICEQRDPKGLYKKARNSQIEHFTGIDSIYEIPDHPDITLNGMHSPVTSVNKILFFLFYKHFISLL